VSGAVVGDARGVAARKSAAAQKKHRPWGDYAFRVVACMLLFASAYGLLAQSTFAHRLRDDAGMGGVSGAQAIALALAGVLAFLPLLAGKRFLGAFLWSAAVPTIVGAYWWTKVSWDELVSESNFNVMEPAGLWDYVLVATPALIAIFYVAASRASRLKAEYRGRGVDERQVTRAACACYLAGVVVFLAVTGLSIAFWAVLTSGALFGVFALMPTGVPAIVLAAAALTAAIALGAGRLPTPKLTRPSKDAEGHGAQGRTRARKSPS
jgi:hypothetical protein